MATFKDDIQKAMDYLANLPVPQMPAPPNPAAGAAQSAAVPSGQQYIYSGSGPSVNPGPFRVGGATNYHPTPNQVEWNVYDPLTHTVQVGLNLVRPVLGAYRRAHVDRTGNLVTMTLSAEEYGLLDSLMQVLGAGSGDPGAENAPF